MKTEGERVSSQNSKWTAAARAAWEYLYDEGSIPEEFVGYKDRDIEHLAAILQKNAPKSLMPVLDESYYLARQAEGHRIADRILSGRPLIDAEETMLEESREEELTNGSR